MPLTAQNGRDLLLFCAQVNQELDSKLEAQKEPITKAAKDNAVLEIEKKMHAALVRRRKRWLHCGRSCAHPPCLLSLARDSTRPYA